MFKTLIGKFNDITSGYKTLAGILVALVPSIAGWLGYSVTIEGATDLVDILGNLIIELEDTLEAGGLLFAGYGRIVTKK